MKTNVKNATKKIIPTSGEVFPDGAMIELVCGPVGSRPRLLLWNGAVKTLSQRVKYGDCFYEPAHMPLGIYRATRLPARYEDHQSVGELFNRIQKLFNEHLRFGERESRLLAAFSISTWVADRLPCAPSVVISSFSQALGVELLKLLSCVCRHPLLLAEVTPASFRALPMELFLTLLISQAAPRPALLRLVGASQHRGMHLLGKGGSVTDVYGPKVILGGTDALAEYLSESMIQISMAQAQARRTVLDEHVQQRIADEFQPQLLSYRLKTVARLRESPGDHAEFSAATLQLASALGKCFSEDPQLARKTVELLRYQDDDARAERQCDVSSVAVEVLWGLIHHGSTTAIKVDELGKMINTLLRSRGVEWSYSAEEIGWKLKGLGIPRHSSAAGREVLLDRANRHRIHQLACADFLGRSQSFPDCQDCKARQVAASM